MCPAWVDTSQPGISSTPSKRSGRAAHRLWSVTAMASRPAARAAAALKGLGLQKDQALGLLSELWDEEGET